MSISTCTLLNKNNVIITTDLSCTWIPSEESCLTKYLLSYPGCGYLQKTNAVGSYPPLDRAYDTHFLLPGHSARPLGEYGLSSRFASASGSSLIYLELLPSIFHYGVKQTKHGVDALHYLTELQLSAAVGQTASSYSQRLQYCQCAHDYVRCSLSQFSSSVLLRPPVRWCTMGNQVDEYLCYEHHDLPRYISLHGCNQARQFSASNFLLRSRSDLTQKPSASQLFVQRSLHQQKYHRHPTEQVLPQKTWKMFTKVWGQYSRMLWLRVQGDHTGLVGAYITRFNAKTVLLSAFCILANHRWVLYEYQFRVCADSKTWVCG